MFNYWCKKELVIYIGIVLFRFCYFGFVIYLVFLSDYLDKCLVSIGGLVVMFVLGLLGIVLFVIFCCFIDDCILMKRLLFC